MNWSNNLSIMKRNSKAATYNWRIAGCSLAGPLWEVKKTV